MEFSTIWCVVFSPTGAGQLRIAAGGDSIFQVRESLLGDAIGAASLDSLQGL